MLAAVKLTSATRQNLWRLTFIRTLVLAAQAGSVGLAYWFNLLPLPWLQLAVTLGFSTVLCVFTAIRLRTTWPVTELEYSLQLACDLFIHSVLLYFSGGSTNPFVSYYLVPLTIAAVTLPWRYSVVLSGIAILLLVYGAATAAGLPQRGARLIAQQIERGPSHEESTERIVAPPHWMILPFVLLLGVIAVFPLAPGIDHWWDNNLHRFYLAAGLGLATILYYLFLHEHAVIGHWPVEHTAAATPSGPNVAVAATVLGNAILGEYVPFIVLLFTLYTISGGIRIEGNLPAEPATNAAFLVAGAVLASLIGTTGAAMLLVRPLLETNRERKHVRHTVVFFIFVVCNCGGCLLPLGDPPLFLGYLLGVPFLWTLKLWPAWLFVNGALVAAYYLWDRFWCYPKESPADLAQDHSRSRRLRLTGLWPNAVLLVGVVLSVALLDPTKPVPGLGWRPWVYLREIVQLALVAVSLALGSNVLRQRNGFTYHAIVEVAALFLGIFICMQAPLQILHVEGPALGLSTPTHFFWATGSLSSFLDNAPTYVVFFETARSLAAGAGQATVAGVGEGLLAAVSLGAVFMGSMTYIGNGPNFMVRAIAEKSGVPMPSFFGYMVYSCLVLLPLFALTVWLFLD